MRLLSGSWVRSVEAKAAFLSVVCLLLVGCPKAKPQKIALPGCNGAALDQTRSSLEAEAKRALDKNDIKTATLSLEKAACYEGEPDLLLLDLAARAVLVDLIKRRSQAKEAAVLLLNTKGGKEEVIRLAKDANPSVAVSLWAALADRRDEDAREPLKALAQDPDPGVRITALRALLRLDALSAEDAQTAMSSENPAMRALGVEIAARYNPSLLRSAAEDPDAQVRAAVVYSLPVLSTEDAADLAGLLLFDEDLGVRLAAFELSLQIGVAKEETVAAALVGKDPLLALAAARSAGASNPEAVKVLLNALETPGAARRNALLLSGSFKDAAKEIVPKLYTVINTAESVDERVLAAAALLQLEPVLPAGKQAREAQEEANQTLLAACNGEGRPAVRGCAELAPRGDEKAKQQLRAKAVSDPDPIARSAALRALGLFGQEFIAEIAAALADPEDAVRLVAAQQILKIVGSNPRPYGRQ